MARLNLSVASNSTSNGFYEKSIEQWNKCMTIFKSESDHSHRNEIKDAQEEVLGNMTLFLNDYGLCTKRLKDLEKMKIMCVNSEALAEFSNARDGKILASYIFCCDIDSIIVFTNLFDRASNISGGFQRILKHELWHAFGGVCESYVVNNDNTPRRNTKNGFFLQISSESVNTKGIVKLDEYLFYTGLNEGMTEYLTLLCEEHVGHGFNNDIYIGQVKTIANMIDGISTDQGLTGIEYTREMIGMYKNKRIECLLKNVTDTYGESHVSLLSSLSSTNEPNDLLIAEAFHPDTTKARCAEIIDIVL